MPEDSKMKLATMHWMHRCISNGVILADYQDIASSINSWDEWCAAWSKRAAIHEEIGREAVARSQFVSAGEHLTRAGVYYHFAKFLFVHDIPQMKAAHKKAVDCRRSALPYLSPPGERVDIPYEGKHLAGILRRPAGIAEAPIVVMIMGLDSCKEEMDGYERTFLDRGMATLAFEGPGQGEAEYDFPIRGDFEVPLKAVFDWVSKQRGIDADRIGLWGVSLGGYYAPRAAAFDKRIKACVALSGPYDFAEMWDTIPDLTRAAFRVRAHCATDEEGRKVAATVSLKGVTKNITCPMYIITGRLDRVVPAEHAERLAREVSGPVELLVVEDGNHVVNNRPYRYRPQSADWLAANLRATK